MREPIGSLVRLTAERVIPRCLKLRAKCQRSWHFGVVELQREQGWVFIKCQPKQTINHACHSVFKGGDRIIDSLAIGIRPDASLLNCDASQINCPISCAERADLAHA